MTSRQSERYGPMIFDASDVTTMKRRVGYGFDAARQSEFYPSIFGTNRIKAPDRLTPSQYTSAGIASQYCSFKQGQYCPLPVIISQLTLVGSYTPIDISTGGDPPAVSFMGLPTS